MGGAGATSTNDLAKLEFEGRIARLSLNRPDARNALSIPLLEALHARADELASRPDATVLVLTGEGKAFCAGMDLKAVLNEPGAPERLLSSLAEFALKLRRLPQVTVARVNGAAIGGGCGLACVCDFAITHADSKMGFPEVDLGVCPAVVAPWLVRKVGPGRARRILLSGGLLTGRQAFEEGIVTQAVADLALLDGAVQELADRISKGGPEALRATKSLLNELDGSLDGNIARRGALVSAAVLNTEESKARLRERLK